MENMWQFKNTELNSKTPKEILKEQAELLPSLTGDMVYASVVEANKGGFAGGFTNDFMFSFLIKSKFLSNYQYRVLTISHGVPIYPVKVELDDDIRNELGTDPFFEIANNEEEFKELLRKALGSNRIGVVISSIIQLSK